MMKTINFIFSMAVIIMLIAPAGFGFAQSSVSLGVESTGLLPSNPFYFLKEWGRGFRKFITFNALGKAELELDVVNEKVAELKKLEEITPENVNVLMGSVENYKLAVEQLRVRLEGLEKESIKYQVSSIKSGNVDRLLTQITEQSFKHQQLFDDLAGKFSLEEKFRQSLNELQEKLADLLATASERLDSPKKFRARLEAALKDQKDEFKELRVAELADRLEKKLSGDVKKEVSAFKDDLLTRFSGRLQGAELSSPLGASAILERLPGEPIHRLKLLDEVREKVINSNLKNELNIVRQRILDEAVENKQIGQEEAQKAIDSARQMIAEVETEIVSDERTIRQSVAELLQRAKFNLAQAEKFFEETNYGGAFGQATAAYAAIKNSWAQLMPDLSDNTRTLETIKNYYDNLSEKARSAGLAKEEPPKLFELLAEAEKKIVELTRLIEKKSPQEIIAASLRSIKLILATAEELIAASLRSAE